MKEEVHIAELSPTLVMGLFKYIFVIFHGGSVYHVFGD